MTERLPPPKTMPDLDGMTARPETHPVQKPHRQGGGRISTKVTLAAYEVYRRVCGPQEALITGNCRGGFSVAELIAFLYAKPFPQSEWRKRFEEALDGMENL